MKMRIKLDSLYIGFLMQMIVAILIVFDLAPIKLAIVLVLVDTAYITHFVSKIYKKLHIEE